MFQDPSWPPPESCEKHGNAAWDDYPSAYIDPEARGFKYVKQLLRLINQYDILITITVLKFVIISNTVSKFLAVSVINFLD